MLFALEMGFRRLFLEGDSFFVSRAVNRAARTLTLEGRRQQISYVWVDGALESVRNMANKDQMVGIQNR